MKRRRDGETDNMTIERGRVIIIILITITITITNNYNK